MQSVQIEILDILQMGPETAEELATMLDEESERALLKEHRTVRDGLTEAVCELVDVGLVRKSVRYREAWELTSTGKEAAKQRSIPPAQTPSAG